MLEDASFTWFLWYSAGWLVISIGARLEKYGSSSKGRLSRGWYCLMWIPRCMFPIAW